MPYTYLVTGNKNASLGLLDLLELTGMDLTRKCYSLEEADLLIKQGGWQSPIGTERWEMHLNTKIQAHKLQTLAKNIIQHCSQHLGMLKQISPVANDYHAVLFLGANLPRVISRVNFYLKQRQSGNIDPNVKIWVLTGERQLSVQAGETTQALLDLVPSGVISCAFPVNELQMIQYVFHYLLPNDLDVEYVDSLRDINHKRATTESTMITFLEKLNLSNPVKLLAISNQPLIAYQQSVIDRVLHKTNQKYVKVDVVGDKVSDTQLLTDNLAAILLDSIAKTISNLCNLEN